MMIVAHAVSRSTTRDLSERIQDARQSRRPLRVVGAGTWLNGGAPVDATETISCGNDDIIEYVPGDLTITVGAAITLAAIRDATAKHDQWLTLDPFGSQAGTIGATVATASSGPLATAFGTPRDLVLGLEAVTGTGQVIRAGGRVVKNVAGFDLSRLFTGSRGTIGVITELTLRLRGRPAQDVTVAISADGTVAGLRSICRALREWPFTPMAAQILDSVGAAAVGLPQQPTLVLRLGGNAKSVAAQRRLAASLGKTTEVDASIWDRLRNLESGAAGVLRVSDLPTAFAERWVDAQQMTSRAGIVLGTPTRGTLRCVLGEVDTGRVAAFRARSNTATVVFDSLPTPADWHSLTDEIDPASLDAKVRAVFDPAGILNPGIMRVTR